MYNKEYQRKLVGQIKRLCEKQYRKGFQQGFETAINKEMSHSAVNKFRLNGSLEEYKNLEWPHNGRKEDPSRRLLLECMMSDMEELVALLRDTNL